MVLHTQSLNNNIFDKYFKSIKARVYIPTLKYGKYKTFVKEKYKNLKAHFCIYFFNRRHFKYWVI